MNFSEMEMKDLEARIAEITAEATEERTLEELTAYKDEKKAIEEEIAKRKADEAERRSIAAEIASNAVDITPVTEKKEERKMSEIEMRNTPEYINAYAEYIKTGDDTECRALLSTNATSGKVAIPTVVYDITKTAWERDGITARVRKAYLRGNLKVGFEISSTGATIHTEGAAGVAEETLVLGVVELVPQSIKKWISMSDEVLDLRGEAFLNYIYDELTYQIAKKAADALLDKIIACGTASTTTQVGVAVVTAATIGIGTIASAMGELSDEAENPIAIMNKATWAAFKGVQAANGYNYDVFEGLPVVYSNHLPAFATASTGDTYAIVGDLGHGALMNFPNGDGIDFKFDDISLATSDLVKVIGREFVGIGVVAPFAFTKIVK